MFWNGSSAIDDWSSASAWLAGEAGCVLAAL
jgi:hypothetical protein